MHRSLLALADLAFIASCNEEDPDALFADVRDFSVTDGQDGTVVADTGTLPCEVELISDGDGSFTGTVECHGIPHRVTAAATRHVFAPGTTVEPADISVQGCAGV